MATLTLTVPDALLRRARARLDDNGGGVQDYLINALAAIASDKLPLDPALEAKLLEGLNSPRIELTKDYWKAKLKRFDARHRKSSRK